MCNTVLEIPNNLSRLCPPWCQLPVWGTLEEHNTNLRKVLGRLHERRIRLKPKKCEFAKPQVAFLGFIVSGEGIKPDPQKVDKLRNYPVPTNVKQLRAFLGLGSYYRRFIPGFASVAAPLNALTTEAEWNWTDECQKVFEALRTAIVEGVVQDHPDFSKPFIVDTDASEIGMGAILSQVDDEGRERIVMVDSRKFNRAESKWHIREKEALGIIWALEKFRPFVLGTEFVVRTDHSSLKWLLEAKTGRLERWALRLSEFTPFKIVHRSGVSHGNVDAFTRVFAESDCVPDHHVAGAVTLLEPIFPEVKVWIEAQKEDKSCQRMRELCKTVKRKGLLGMGRRNAWRPILPRSLVKDVARRFHESILGAHLGARKVLSVLSRKVIISGGTKLVKEVIRGCLACAQRKPPKQRLGHMASKPPRYPWETVAMDFCGPYATTESGMRYVLVLVDHFTKWVELVPTTDMQAITVVRAFYQRVICQHGVPGRLLSDNGPQFRSALVEALCKYFGIDKVYSSTYYPPDYRRTLTLLPWQLRILEPHELLTDAPAVALQTHFSGNFRRDNTRRRTCVNQGLQHDPFSCTFTQYPADMGSPTAFSTTRTSNSSDTSPIPSSTFLISPAIAYYTVLGPW